MQRAAQRYFTELGLYHSLISHSEDTTTIFFYPDANTTLRTVSHEKQRKNEQRKKSLLKIWIKILFFANP